MKNHNKLEADSLNYIHTFVFVQISDDARSALQNFLEFF